MRTDGRQTVIRLPNGKACSIGTYCKAWRKLKELPAGATVNGFDHFGDDAGRILRQLRSGIHDRINRHLPAYGKGRKWSHDWFMDAWRLSRDVNHRRLVVRVSTVPIEFRDRLAHRLTHNDDW